MSDAIREAFEKWYFEEVDDIASFIRYLPGSENYDDPYVQDSWKAYKVGASHLATANARIAELEARCPVSCAKRGTPP